MRTGKNAVFTACPAGRQARPRWIPQGGLTDYQAVGHEYRQDDMPSIAPSPDGSVWVAWLSFDGSGDDIHPRVGSDGQGQTALVWQGFRKRDGRSSVAVDSQGVAWIAYDSYRQGNYDVFLARVTDGEVVEPAIPVAVTPQFEARAAVAVDTAGRVWVTWERGPSSWGKDLDRILPDWSIENTLGSPRRAEIAFYQGGHWWEPKKPLSDAYHNSDTYHPRVFSDGAGSVWVAAMSRQRGAGVRPNPDSRPAYWELYMGRPLGF